MLHLQARVFDARQLCLFLGERSIESTLANAARFPLFDLRIRNLLGFVQCISVASLRLLTLLGVETFLGSLALHNRVELLVIDITFLAHSLLQLLNSLHVLALLRMPLVHSESLEGLVELLILLFRLLLLELIHLLLLLQQSLLNLAHMLIALKHFGEEVSRARNRNVALNKNFHAFHDIITSGIVHAELSLQIIVNLHLVYDSFFLFFSGLLDSLHSHVFTEWYLALLLDQIGRLEAIVEALAHFVKSLLQLGLVAYGILTELLDAHLLKLLVCHALNLFGRLTDVTFISLFHISVGIYLLLRLLSFFNLVAFATLLMLKLLHHNL